MMSWILVHRVQQLILPVIFLSLSACSSIPTVPVSFHIKAEQNINGDYREHTLPVSIRIYQLNQLSAFQEATFRQLWKKDQQVLADTLLATKEITVIPGAELNFKLDRKPETKYIGIIAIFRDPHHSQWRTYKALHSQAASLIFSMSVILKGNSIKILRR